MSRGPGRLQRFILDGMMRAPEGEAYPAPVIARSAHWLPPTASNRASVRRAIGRLTEEEVIASHEYLLPTAITAGAKPINERWTLCIAPADADWTDRRYYDSAREKVLDLLIADAQAEVASALGREP